eukprot:298633-Chlamydomonas_euryale.AAC.1
MQLCADLRMRSAAAYAARSQPLPHRSRLRPHFHTCRHTSHAPTADTVARGPPADRRPAQCDVRQRG